MADSRISLNELKAFIDVCIRCAEVAIANLRFDPRDPVHQLLIGLLYATVDYAGSVSALIAAQSYKGIPALARSAMYAYVDVVNLCGRSGYREQLELLDDFQWKKILERASAGDNPYLASLSHSDLLVPGRKLHARQLKEAQERQVKKLEIDDRFRLAGLHHEYESAYSLLSADAHNAPSSVRMYFDSTYDPPRLRPRRREAENGVFVRSGSMMVAETVLQATEKVLGSLQHGMAVMGEARREFERLCDRFD